MKIADILPMKVAEGKTKVICATHADPTTVYMVFKDDITAGDGVKHDIIEGKALIDWQTNKDIFEFLNRHCVFTHYLSCPAEKVVLVKKLDRKIDLEVVTRRVATGSILGWGNVAEGTRFDPIKTQFHYKDDPLHDPMLDPGYVNYLINMKAAVEYHAMQTINTTVFYLLESAFARFDLQLIDLKLEYGLIGEDVCLIDEITGGSFRLWPYAHPKPNLQQKNVLSELDPNARLDKDTYRMGEELDHVKSRFEHIARITDQFKNIVLF